MNYESYIKNISKDYKGEFSDLIKLTNSLGKD